MVIYEMYVWGFIKDFFFGVKENYWGIFVGIFSKIFYLQELGVNIIELMLIFEFDEFEYSCYYLEMGEFLVNYWGYSIVNFFVFKVGYVVIGKFGMQIDELKNLVKELYKVGIFVILDVVFNYMVEGNEWGFIIFF